MVSPDSKNAMVSPDGKKKAAGKDRMDAKREMYWNTLKQYSCASSSLELDNLALRALHLEVQLCDGGNRKYVRRAKRAAEQVEKYT